jgi:Rha family phage regulatory protein
MAEWFKAAVLKTQAAISAQTARIIETPAVLGDSNDLPLAHMAHMAHMAKAKGDTIRATVLEAIRNLNCTSDFHLLNFEEIKYTDDGGRSYPAFEMTRDGFTRLVMSFTDEMAGADRDIRELIEKEPSLATSKFGGCLYDDRGRQMPCYEMTRDGFTRLVMSFTGEKAGLWIEKYISAFTERLKVIADDSPGRPHVVGKVLSAICCV